MPIIPNSAIVNEVLPIQNGQTPFVQQMDFGAMIGSVLAWNPDATAMAPVFLNDALRKVLDRRTWYGLFTKAQVCVPAAVVGGTATVTNGSNLVRGVGTAWTNSAVGMQFRQGYNAPIYTITAVDTVNQVLTLEMPWGGPSLSAGYYIVKYYYSFPNVKYIKTMVNTIMGFKFRLNLTQNFLNARDPWRAMGGNFSWGIAPMPTDTYGNYVFELYPASWTVQAFPVLMYTQPSNLVKDTDTLPPYIRCDVLIKEAIAQVLVWRGAKNNQFYDPGESQRKHAEFEAELNHMAQADENLYRTDTIYKDDGLPYYEPGGGFWNATHAVMAGDDGGW